MIWKPIDSAPTKPVDKADGGNGVEILFGPFVRLRRDETEVLGRWRHPVEAFDIEKGQNLRRQARWEDPNGAPIAFEPTQWAPHSSGMPR
jgi:hypothetical protein